MKNIDGLVPDLWGLVFPLSAMELSLFESIAGASSLSLVRGEGSEVHCLLLGSIAFLNSACPQHANIIPDDNSTALVADPATGMDSSDWKVGRTAFPLLAGSPLLVAYGTDYGGLECPQCPHPVTTTSAGIIKAWNKISSTKEGGLLMPRALADDWVRICILHPLASSPSTDAVTHSIGPIRAALLEHRPPWDQAFRDALNSRPKSTLIRRLRRLAAGLEAAVSGIILATESFWVSFWDYVATFIPSVSIIGSRSSHAKLVPFAGPHGLSLSLSMGVSGESRLLALWGELFPCTSVLSTINMVDGATSASIVKGSRPTSYLLLGPIS